MGIQVYDPGGKIAAAARPRYSGPQQPPSTVRPAGSIYERSLRAGSGAPTAAPAATKAPKEKQGLAQKFFNSPLGKPLGVVLNNPLVKAGLQPLDVLGVPGRAMLGMLEQDIDFLKAGKSADFGKLYNRINPLYAFHGENADDMVSGGQIVQQLGGTDNQYLDALAGFGLDVGLDPLTYAGGAGVVDKGLDALRSGTRLAQAVEAGSRTARVAEEASVGARAATAAADVAEAATPFLDDATRTAEVATKARRGHRGSLTGRQTRYGRIQEAENLIQRADPQVLDELYGGTNVAQEALEEVMRRSGRGLGAGSKTLSPAAQELVETALNIKPPAIRWHVPFTKGFHAVPGTRGVAEGLANTMGKARLGVNSSRLGGAIADISSPLDVEAAQQVLRQGERADPEQFSKATTAYRAFEEARPIAGEYLNEGQRAIRGQRRNILRDIKEAAGNANFIRRAEQKFDEAGNLLPKTRVNQLFDFFREDMARKHGVTIPNLGSDTLNYIPHVLLPDAAAKLGRGDAAFVQKFLDTFGIEGQDLVKESGRMRKRSMLPDAEITLPDGRVVNTGSATIDEINSLGLGKLLEDNPIRLLEDYVQIVSEDVGRRAGRANLIAEGNKHISYAADMGSHQAQEAAMEQMFARARVAGQTAPQWADGVADHLVQGIADGSVVNFMDQAIDEFKRLASSTTVLDPDVLNMMTNLKKQIRNPNMLERAFRKATNYFKTYATLSPGFHVRNALSAIFMNTADGVPLRTTYRGFDLWQNFDSAIRKVDTEGMELADQVATEMAAAEEFLKTVSKAERDALTATWGSGAGGRFAEAGVAEGASIKSRVGSKLLENALTRKTQDIGSWVEGGARTGMALDTVEAGGSIQEAMRRITRVHFDYSQTSRLDDAAKGIFPFWSFMSRNLPLQIMQQWSRPAVYSTHEHLMENLADPTALTEAGIAPEDVPEYIKQGKGVPLGLPGPFNWFEPELPHTRLAEDVERYGNIAQNPAGALSNVNPLITAPIEYTMKGDLFTGQKFGPEDLEQVSNPAELIASLPAWVAGQLEMGTDGKLYVKQEALNAVYSVDPTLSRVARVSGGTRGWETLARWFGAPVRNITPEQVASTQAGQYYDARDEAKKAQTLAGLGG